MLVCNGVEITGAKNWNNVLVISLKLKMLLVVFLCGSFVGQTYCPTVGSNSAPSRQLKPFFPAVAGNAMQGFSVFEQGLILENASTTCIFDAFFPISGTVTLNDGAIILARDLSFKNPLKIGSGMIKGNGYSVVFPNNVSLLPLPTEGHARSLSLVQTSTQLAQVNSVDWSFDNTYLAMTSSTATNAVELQVYYFDGMTLTLTAQYDLGARDLYSVQWHPSAYYLATGQVNDQQLRIFQYTPFGGLTQTSNATIGTINAVAWHPTGNYVAVGRNSATDIRVYGVSGSGVLDASSITSSFLLPRSVQRNALDWHSTGSYLVAGFESHMLDTELKVFSFNGTQLNVLSELDFGATVYGVRFHPTLPLVAAGLSAGTQRLVVCDFIPTATMLVQHIVTGEQKITYAVDWSPDGNYLATGRQSVTDNMELQVYKFHSDYSLELVSAYEMATNLLALKWSRNGKHLATGDSLKYLKLFSFFDGPLIFENARIFFESDIMFTAPIYFKGVCTINGGGNILDFVSSSSLVVMPGASLTIEQAIIQGIRGNKIQCQDDTGVITLRNVRWIQEDDAFFDKGALLWKNEVTMEGEATFAYQSSKTSTLLAKSHLQLDTGFTFSYDPVNSASKNLIQFADATAKLILNGATLHTTATGMELRKGKVMVERDSFLSSQAYTVEDQTVDNGITFGNNLSADDFVCEILSGVTLHVKAGTFSYKNVNAASWTMLTDTSILKLLPSTTLNLYQMLDATNGGVTFGENTTYARAADKKIVGPVNIFGYVSFTNLAES